ncbi:metalloprotease, partial [Escherichia coli]
MKLKTISALAVSAVVLAGCQNMNYDTLAQSG